MFSIKYYFLYNNNHCHFCCYYDVTQTVIAVAALTMTHAVVGFTMMKLSLPEVWWVLCTVNANRTVFVFVVLFLKALTSAVVFSMRWQNSMTLSLHCRHASSEVNATHLCQTDYMSLEDWEEKQVSLINSF